MTRLHRYTNAHYTLCRHLERARNCSCYFEFSKIHFSQCHLTITATLSAIINTTKQKPNNQKIQWNTLFFYRWISCTLLLSDSEWPKDKTLLLTMVSYVKYKRKSCEPFWRTALKVALSQKRLENFFVARINIPNHSPEQKI